MTREELIEAILRSSKVKEKRKIRRMQKQQETGHKYRVDAWRHDAKQWQKNHGYE